MTVEEIQLVIEQELALLTPEVRSSANELEDLLAQDFSEIGASGRLWTREEMISLLTADTTSEQAAITYSDMAGRLVGVDLVLLTYLTEVEGRKARRSSLWRRRGTGGWTLVHHQGTLVA